MSKGKIIDADKMEELITRFSCGCSALDLINDSFDSTSNKHVVKEANEAVWFVTDTLRHIAEDMETEFEKAPEVEKNPIKNRVEKSVTA